MNLKTKLSYKVFLIVLLISFQYGTGYWVNYGWEIFNYVTSAHVASLGNATIAYPIKSAAGSIINPFSQLKDRRKIELSHQSRYSGLINSDIIGGQILVNQKTALNFNILYEGIGSIPDTRGALMDWGLDGVIGTNDIGENNGVLDEGERLDKSKINYFSQRQIAFHSSFLRSVNNQNIGFGIKFLHYKLDNHFALGFGLDLGKNIRIKGVDYAVVLRNFPSSGLIWDQGTIEGTTPSFSFGVHLPYSFKKYPVKYHFLISIDMNTDNRDLDSRYNFGRLNLEPSYGFELKLLEKICIRLGRNKLNVITGGLGVNWSLLEIDYAFIASNFGTGLGNHHLFTISISKDILKKYFKNSFYN